MSEQIDNIGKNGHTALLAVLEVMLSLRGGHEGFVEEMAMYLPKNSLEQLGYNELELPDFFIFTLLSAALQSGVEIPKGSILERSVKRYGRAHLYSE